MPKLNFSADTWQRYLWYVEHQNVVFADVVAVREHSGWCCPTYCMLRRPTAGHGFTAMDCCAATTTHIHKQVEGVKAVANTGVGSVGIHDYVGVVHSPNEKLHGEPEQPAVVASLVQACNVIFHVHGCHVPATRGKVTRNTRGQTFMQNCVKKAGSLLTWCRQTQTLTQSTVQAGR